MQPEINEPIPTESKKRKGIFFWLGRLFLFFIILFFAVIAFIHLPPFQQWGIGKISKAISTNLNAKVSLGGFELHPISDLMLKDIFIGSPDHPGDTLIYAERLYIDYKRIWDVFFRRMTITQIGINNGLLNIHRVAGDSLTNLDVTLLRLLPPRNPAQGDFALDLKSINAVTLGVRVDDENNGTLMSMFFKRADVELDTMDIIDRYLAIKDLDLDEPYIKVINRPPMMIFPADTTIASKLWALDVGRCNLQDGKLLVDNRTKPVIFFEGGRGIDYAHLALDDVDIRFDSLVIRGWEFKGKDIDIHLLHENGFEIQKLAAAYATVSKNGTVLEQFEIKTPDSEINNSISVEYSGYTDFKNFVDSVKLDIPDANIRLRVNDLLELAPGLQSVTFFRDNATNDITLQGKVTGSVNRLKILNMRAGLGALSLTGDFRSRNLAVKGDQLISLDLKGSAFSTTSLRRIFPKMKIPTILDKLGNINFVGKFDGYPDDFVAYGTFNTSLGSVTMDMNLNTVKGLDEGKFSGEIALQNFDLGTFLDQKDIGKISMSGRVLNGTGLTSETLKAEIIGELSYLEYKGYRYHNARIDGQITGKLFNGTLDINDPNIDMHFEGYVDLRDSMPKLDFVSRVDNIQFHMLGLTKDTITISGIFDVNLTAGDWEKMSGTLEGEKVVLNFKNQDYILDTIQLSASVDTLNGDRVYFIHSDILSGSIAGVFNPASLVNQVHHYLHEHYPSSIDEPEKPLTSVSHQRVTWNLRIPDSRDWFKIMGQEDLRIVNGASQGTLDLGNAHTIGTLDLPELHYGKFNVYYTTISFEESNGRANADLELIAADVNESFFFEDIYLTGSATDDSVRVNIKTDHVAEVIDELDLDIAADPEGGTWNLSFNPRKLVMLGNDWSVPEGNRVEIKKDEFSIDNFELVSQDQKIILDDIDRHGLKAYISGFDVSYLNELWINDKFEFSGQYTLDFEVDDLYDIQSMHLFLKIPELTVNNVPYGDWELNARMRNPQDSVKIDLVMHNNETSLIGKGAYLPPIKSIPKEKQNYLNLDLIATEFPLDFLEFLLGGNIRDTEGSVDMTLNLSGKANQLNPNGKGKVYNGSTVIDYLGAAYSFHDQTFTITETMIDLSGTKIYDVLGNTATVEGGITHRYLRDLGLNATITSDKMLGLDVTSEENNVFYGQGIGSVYARFSGTIANPTMHIQATTAEGTHIYIPLSGSAAGGEGDFAIFLENGMLPANTSTKLNLGGINLTINLTITNDAIVEIIFDENSGEVLRGIGEGNIQLSMTRTGNFSMYGNYYIEEGDYLFTNFAIVRKPFELVGGSRIQWGGDPYDATLNVQAIYNLTTSVYPLIQEFLTDQQTQAALIDEAKERTEVELTMNLTGSLLHPDISFDIDFPALSGELKGYVISKINTLKANESAMNQQVMGLLVTRSFLPSTSSLAAPSTFIEGVDNTLTELLSSTLSSYLGSLLGDFIPTGDFLSGIDFRVDVETPIFGATTTPTPDGELEDPNVTDVGVVLPLEFFNDRLSVNVGGNYVTGATLYQTPEYWAGDVTFEYSITEDRRLKVRAYNRNTMTIEGRKNKVGLGLAYRREYDTFGEFLGKKKREANGD